MDDGAELSNRLTNVSLSNLTTGHPTMSLLALRQKTHFPTPFGHDDVRKTLTQPRVLMRSNLVDYDDPVEDEPGAPPSVLRLKKDSDSNKSRGSAHSATPSKRATSKGTVVTRRAWLTGWLLYVDMFYCHITHTEACAHLLIQFAHVILPQSERDNDSLITFYEYILGMHTRTLSIHSRLFLLPLKNNIHVYLDDHIFIMLPCLYVLRKMHEYFLKVVNARATQDQGSLWIALRQGDLDLKDFIEGSIHRYHVVLHPGANRTIYRDLLPFDEPDFYSHISPFAALLNAFRTLRHWYNARACPGYKPVPGQTLSNALERSGIPDGKAILTTVRAINSQISALKTVFEDESRSEWKSKWKGGGGGGGGDGDILREFGLDGMDFGKWTGNQGDEGGARDFGGHQQESSPSDASEIPLEDTILLLVPDESVDSVWSDSDTNDGMLTEEPSLHDPSNGPSPSQRIVDEWRGAIPQFTALPSPRLTSDLSLVTACHPSVSSSMASTTVIPSPASPSPSSLPLRKFPWNAWPSRNYRPVKNGAGMKQVVKASARAVTLRILGDWNAIL